MTVEMHGIGCIVVNTHVTTAGVRARQRIFATPIDEDTVILRGGGTMKAMPDPNMTAMISKLFFQGFVQDVEQDFEIWENKAYFERPVLAANDGPIGAYRKWCRRFYDESRAEAAE